MTARAPSSKAALRMRRCRQRKRDGRAIISVEVNLFELTDMLIARGFLAEWDSGSYPEVEAAFERFIEAFCVECDA